MGKSDREQAQIFKALGDENRLRIVKLLQTGEKCACVLLEDLDVTQPTLSHHMKILCDSNIVKAKREGKWIYYSLCLRGCEEAITLLSHLTSLV